MKNETLYSNSTINQEENIGYKSPQKPTISTERNITYENTLIIIQKMEDLNV